ncbi:MAG: signal peptidase II [Magnetococcales bacterium]|nr:signal peptidase II [Magnetococcales bacterium]MBF0439237.1 signal peptidase II [Magnetococcales bacterium]
MTMEWRSKRIGMGLLLAVVVILLDQLSKWIAVQTLAKEAIILFPGFFDLVLVHNAGAAFGLFTGLSPDLRLIFLCSVALIASLIILRLLQQAHSGIQISGLGMILGGALGNLIDRVRFGAVVDFIHLHWHELSWPVFNLADSAITVGVGLLLLDHLTTSDP